MEQRWQRESFASASNDDDIYIWFNVFVASINGNWFSRCVLMRAIYLLCQKRYFILLHKRLFNAWAEDMCVLRSITPPQPQLQSHYMFVMLIIPANRLNMKLYFIQTVNRRAYWDDCDSHGCFCVKVSTTSISYAWIDCLHRNFMWRREIQLFYCIIMDIYRHHRNDLHNIRTNPVKYSDFIRISIYLICKLSWMSWKFNNADLSTRNTAFCGAAVWDQGVNRKGPPQPTR